MDFALLPPEVNSGRMYAGAGAGPLLAAATAWDGLAAELHTVGLAYDSVLAELHTGWSGPSAASMASAAAPYAAWMHTASVHAEETAIQARAAAAAYETAFAMTVPPPVIAANRAQLLTLIATNFLGQNTPAIAATEALYAQMWAQDATAMYGYAAGAASATRLTPFTPPPKTTGETGPANQLSAVGQAAGRAAAETGGDNLISSILQGAPNLPSGAGAALGGAALTGELATELGIAGLELIVDSVGTFGIDALGTFLIDVLGAAGVGAAALEAGMAAAAPVAAGVGSAASIGALSVPLAWAVAASSAAEQVGMSLVAAGSAVAGIVTGETVIPAVGMAAAGLAGRAGAGAAGRSRVPSGGMPKAPAPSRRPNELPELPPVSAFGLLMGADVELRELAELRGAGILTDEEYTAQRKQLVGR